MDWKEFKKIQRLQNKIRAEIDKIGRDRMKRYTNTPTLPLEDCNND